MFPQIFGKYVLERELARGGMARVFLATLRGAGGFEKRLVVKQIRPELASDQAFTERFVAEAKTSVELSHANIVPVYELGTEQGTYFIAMEYCEGVSLAELLTGGALTPAEGAYIGVEISRALDYAHRRARIVHRDVTPRNVMIDPEGMVRLIDFGIAARADADVSGKHPLFGSPGHMPPEQLRRGPLTPAADVFAVAALLVETWTGRPPFRRDSFEASAKALTMPAPDLGRANSRLAELASLITAALSLEPGQRPQTAEEFARPLREFLRQSDLGDIARRLGERVVLQLKATGEAHTSLAAAPQSASPSSTSSSGMGRSGVTQTFAAHDAMLEWTAKIDSQPPRAPAHRHSGGVVRDPEGHSASLAAPAMRLERWPNAHRLAFSVGVVAAAALGAAHLTVRGAASHVEVDGSRAPLAPRLSDEVKRSAAPRVLPALAALSPSARDSTGEERDGDTAPATASPAVASPPAPLQRRRKAAAEVTAVQVRSVNPAETARVHITAEPLALVRVDAALVGQTPLLNLTLSPGRHELVFESSVLGEKLEAALTLRAGELQQVHADFTSAAPRIYVR